MTLREQIVRAVVERLGTLQSLPRSSIYRSRQQALSANELPALVVRKVSDAVGDRPGMHDLTLGVEVYTRGEAAEADADPITEEAHRKLAGFVAATNVALIPDDTAFDDADADGGAHRTVMIWKARYFCDMGDLAQPIR